MKDITFDFGGWLEQEKHQTLVETWAEMFIVSVNTEDQVHQLEIEAAYDAGFAACYEAGEHGLAKV